jgi:general secretion pathway protein C
MLTTRPATWTVRGATFALAALAGLSAVYWVLKLGGPSAAVNAPVSAGRSVAAPDPGAIARLLGGTATAMPAAAPALASLASRLQLVGVVAGASSGGGAAVISVDGKPAKPYRVGSQLEEGLVLQSVRGRQAVVAPANGGAVTLELPAASSRPQAAIAAPR